MIFQKRNITSEINLGFDVVSSLTISSGIGYKRLLNVETRSIAAVQADSQGASINFDPSVDIEVLNNARVLNDPTVNRNSIYTPLELKFSFLNNINFALGTQFYLSNTFQ